MNKIPFISPADRDEVALRVSRLQAIMAKEGVGAILVSSNANIYYTSMRFFRGYVFIPAKGEPVYLVIRPNNLEGPQVTYIRKPEQIPALIPSLPERIAIECDTLSMNEGARLQKALGAREFADASPLLKRARMVKTPFEIELMREDGRRQAAAYGRISSVWRQGMTDVEFQIEVERLLRLEGSLGFYRTSGNLMEISMGSVINGDNADAPTPYDFAMGGAGVSASLPVGANGLVMKPGTTIMVDMNGAFNGYQTDMTRVWSVGPVSDLAQRAHGCSLAILRRLEEVGVPGFPVASLYAEAMEIVAREGLEPYFMGHSQQVAFIGHGVGIELNELPVVMARSKDILSEGMTLALEPKFVIPGTGAVGAENTYVVTPSGLEPLTLFPEGIQQL